MAATTISMTFELHLSVSRFMVILTTSFLITRSIKSDSNMLSSLQRMGANSQLDWNCSKNDYMILAIDKKIQRFAIKLAITFFTTWLVAVFGKLLFSTNGLTSLNTSQALLATLSFSSCQLKQNFKGNLLLFHILI